MNIHEYQAKEILTKYGVATPKGGIAYSPENAKDMATELGGDMWVVKAQKYRSTLRGFMKEVKIRIFEIVKQDNS